MITLDSIVTETFKKFKANYEKNPSWVWRQPGLFIFHITCHSHNNKDSITTFLKIKGENFELPIKFRHESSILSSFNGYDIIRR